MTTMKQAAQIEKRLRIHNDATQCLLGANIGLTKEEASAAALKLCRLFRPELFQGGK